MAPRESKCGHSCFHCNKSFGVHGAQWLLVRHLLVHNFFFHRLLSMVVVFRVNAKRPYDKKMGPIGHANIYLTLLPYSIQWLMNSKPAKGATLTDKIHYGFIAYTTVITSISLLLDSKVAYQMVLGNDPGLYPFAPKGSDEKKTE